MPPITVTPEQLLMYYKRYFTAMEDPESTESIREYHFSNLQYALAIFLADHSDELSSRRLDA